ncbi:MAG TPA: S49 family peptidase [Crocinitomicaceae bacterium]|nr:S49 family peptidase [Crocinitomicaceae bacterium]
MEIKNVRKVSFWRIFFATLAALLVASIISIIMFFSALGGVMGAFMSDKDLSSEVKDNTFLYLKLDKPVGDVGFSRINASNFSIDEQQGLGEIIYGLEKAKKDPKIKGIFIETGAINSGYGNLFELREAIKDFEKSGKKVVFYAKGEAISLKALYLSTVTKDNYVFPESNVEFLGLSSELMFFKNTLDKLGVEVQVIRGENNDFKSAVEPYFRTDMSDSSRLQVERFMNGIWNKLLTDISADKGISVEKLNNFASNATILNGRDAAKNGLFSETKYRDEILDLLKKYAGSEKDAPLYSLINMLATNTIRKLKPKKVKMLLH